MMARRVVEKILVIKLSALGDFVLALAAMKKIRLAHPKAHITLLTTAPFEALAKASPYFNAVVTDGRPEGFAQWMALRSRLRAAGYARVYDLQTSAHSNRASTTKYVTCGSTCCCWESLERRPLFLQPLGSTAS